MKNRLSDRTQGTLAANAGGKVEKSEEGQRLVKQNQATVFYLSVVAYAL